MKKNQKSLFYELFLSISFTILLAAFIITKVLYDSSKEYLIKDVYSDIHTSILQLKDTIYPLIESYSISEYENIIKNELNHKHLLAIIVDDYNMSKMTNSKYLIGKLYHNNIIEDYDQNNISHQEILKNAFTKINHNIYSKDKSSTLGEITVYASNTLIQKKLDELIKSSILFALFSTLIILLVLYYVINKIIRIPLSDIIKLIENRSISDLAKYKIPSYNSKELSILSSTLNNMIGSIEDSKYKLGQNIAFLKSYELALDKSSIFIKTDFNGNITYANEYFYSISAYMPEEILKASYSILKHEDNSKEIYEDLWATIKSKKVWKGSLKNKGKINDFWLDSTILPILDENQNIVNFVIVGHDITKIVEQQVQLDKIAKTDILTNLGNRYKLIQDINHSIKPALAIINIDNFSQSNDFYGYETGDKIIKQIALLITKLSKGKNTYSYHIQGDEYVLFNQNIDKNLFEELIYKLLDTLSSSSIKINGENINFNFTTGISFENKDKILTSADMALKIAKRNNKNIVIFQEDISLNKEYENNIYWTKKIKKAIANDSFVPVYQAIVNNKTNKIEKYESLVRLKDIDNLISPFFFLNIAKKTKHYSTITKTMIEKTFERFKDTNIEFSINLTIEDILNKEIKEYIYMMLNSYNCASRVVFEIVESESIENFEAVTSFITKIKNYGCKIAIDDFGTGYSNFVYLMKLSADYIKIDGSLIKEIHTNTQAQIVVSTIVNFANKMKIKTIAEFVENEEIQNKVIELGIDYSQGYYFSKPELNIKN